MAHRHGLPTKVISVIPELAPPTSGYQGSEGGFFKFCTFPTPTAWTGPHSLQTDENSQFRTFMVDAVVIKGSI